MASTSSTMTVPERDASLQVLSSILEGLDEDDQKRLEPFIPEIEEHIHKSIKSVTERKLKLRSKESLLGAALYDAFLTFEERTNVKIGINTVGKVIGIPESTIHASWQSLFDIRVKLDTGRIERVSHVTANSEDSVSEVVSMLRRAIVEVPSGLDGWFARVEERAKDLIQMVDRKECADYPPDIVASTAVWSVIQGQTKPFVQLSQKKVALICNISAQMISKVWVNLFKKGRISGGVL